MMCREVLICLLPFAACFFLGTGIGVGVGRDEDPWIDVVLYGLIAGLHTRHTTLTVCHSKPLDTLFLIMCYIPHLVRDMAQSW